MYLEKMVKEPMVSDEKPKLLKMTRIDISKLVKELIKRGYIDNVEKPAKVTT